MELIDVLHQICQQSQQASAPTDLTTGTVVGTDPLVISINPQMRPIRRQLLYLTCAVIEKKLPLLEHTHPAPGGTTGPAQDHSHTLEDGGSTKPAGGHIHSVSGGETGPALRGWACVEDGKELPIEDGYLILNRGLREGDQVLLLRVRHGQRFVVLSRIYEE